MKNEKRKMREMPATSYQAPATASTPKNKPRRCVASTPLGSVSPDHVFKKYAGRGIKITIRALESDGEVLLIEGEREGLEFLGNLLLAQAKSEDCGFQLNPRGAGKAFFTKASTAGLYIHRLHRQPHAKSKRRNSKPGRTKAMPTPSAVLSTRAVKT